MFLLELLFSSRDWLCHVVGEAEIPATSYSLSFVPGKKCVVRHEIYLEQVMTLSLSINGRNKHNWPFGYWLSSNKRDSRLQKRRPRISGRTPQQSPFLLPADFQVQVIFRMMSCAYQV